MGPARSGPAGGLAGIHVPSFAPGKHFQSRTDRRRNFKQLSSRITLLSAVEDGIYVSDQERTYFMGGGDPGEAVLIDKADYSAIPYTEQKIDAPRIGNLGLSGSAVLWASGMGICLGVAGGQFKNLTEEHFRLQGQPSSGASILRKENKFYQFVCMNTA